MSNSGVRDAAMDLDGKGGMNTADIALGSF